MKLSTSSRVQRRIPLLAILALLLTSLLPTQRAYAAAAATEVRRAVAAPTATSITLDAIDDARTQSGSPTTNFGSGFLWVGQPNVHYSFVQFDLSALPANATITAAGLQLTFTGAYTGTNAVEVGRVDGAWDELTLTWATQPAVTWGGPVKTVTSTGLQDSSVVNWNVTPLAQAWHNGNQPNYGFVLRGNGGELKAFYSKENGTPDRLPRLIIAYTTPAEDGPRPDLGDAPDSTNHHGQNNTAYPGVGTLGQFPTVWDVPAGQAAGPRHRNTTLEGWLGTYISPETEADQGADLDGPNNILRSAGGAVGDAADNDRGDDGWRNRDVNFFDCQRATLDIRVSKAVAATRNFMYLNVWFDGNRDGDWQDLGQCAAADDEPAQASYEWIVQNYIIDMSVIPGGGSYDFSVNTQKVLNSAPNLPHWLRFSLTEQPAVQPEGALPDGRGPHPTSSQQMYEFGETEDVIQKPPPAGEDGQLVIEKRVITDVSPVPYAGTVTYEIRLRNDGGSQPVQAQLRDLLPYPLHVLPQVVDGAVTYVTVTSTTGGVAPLAATLGYDRSASLINQFVSWRGSLAPNAEVRFSFTVHVHPLCQANQQTQVIANVAQARPKGGDPISAEATFTAACPGYDPANIEINPEPIEAVVDPELLQNLQWRGTIRNNHDIPVTLGAVFEPNDANTVTQAAGAELDKSSPLLIKDLVLGPGESRFVNFDLRMEVVFTDELALTSEFNAGGKLTFCFLNDESTACPDATTYPNLSIAAPPVVVKYRPSDLGDAPDSTNHAAAAMAAYPGVQANFPTVFDATTGTPEGPLHRNPRPFHLGQRVSREAEADTGPDQDPLNNIVPATNDPDNDRGDDGTNFALWNLTNCASTNLPVQVAISPLAVNYFQTQATTGYLNIWIDSNRDGDWADATQCGQQPAPEHIVIDFPVDVVALGAGLQTLTVPTGLVPWPNSDKAAWVRITLSELPANKTLTAGALQYGDGRGYATPFKTGETEDYLYRPTTAGGGPDIEVQLTAQSRRITPQAGDLQAAALAGKLGNFEIQLFKIEYGNIGVQTATGAELTFTKPVALRNGQLLVLEAPGIPTERFSLGFEEIKVTFGDLLPNRFGTITLGWTGCLTCTVTAATLNDITANINVTLADDVDPSNNASSATARTLLSSPIIGLALPSANAALCNNEVIEGIAVTNRTTVVLNGRAAPNQQVVIRDGASELTTVQSDNNGAFFYTANLGNGLHTITANYIVSPRDAASGLPTGKLRLFVNAELPFDPSTVCFTDSQGRAYALPTLGYSFGATQTGSWLRRGETYQVSLSGLTNVPNQSYKVTFNDVIISSLVDDDRDGVFVGQATFPDAVHAAAANVVGTLGLVAGNSAGERTFSSDVVGASSGVITDRTTGQPLANAAVTLLQAEQVEDSATVATAFAAQGASQTTGNDGQYSLSAALGVYRIDIVRSGYQSYRSADIDAATASLTPDIALSPVVPDATTHTVYLTANGFAPSALTVTPGSVIEFINSDIADHGVAGTAWDSGLLAPGDRYKVKLPTVGIFGYSDVADALTAGTITVSAESPTTEHALFLPLVQR